MGSGNRFRGLKGWLAACLAATAALYTITLFISIAVGTTRMAVSGQGVMVSLMLFPLIMIVVGLVSAIPSAFAIFVAESFRIRAALFFGGAGVGTGVLGQIVVFRSLNGSAWVFAAAGLVAGLIYWRIAIKPLTDEQA